MSPQEKQQTRLVVDLQQLIAGEKLRVDYQLPAGANALLPQIDALRAQARRAGLPVLDITSGVAGDSCLQRKVSTHFPQGTVRYQSQRDNLLWLDRHLHGQLARRTRDGLILLRPLLRELTGAQVKAAAKTNRAGTQT